MRAGALLLALAPTAAAARKWGRTRAPSVPAAPPPLRDGDLAFPVQTDVPAELSKWFSHYAAPFGVRVFASKKVDDWALQHVARSMAFYLDQDEDGAPDHPEVVREMVSHKACIVLMKNEREYDDGVARVGDKMSSTLAHGVIKNDHPVWNCSVTDTWVFAETWQSENAHDATKPCGKVPPGPAYGRDDATWEEVFHLITHVGYGCAHPQKWGFRADAANPYAYPSSSVPESTISRALDAQLGDCGAAYNNTQRPKHDGQCNYWYDDETCWYPCLVNEYLHMVHMAHIGARDFQCDKEARRDYYSFCTHELCEKNDPVGFALGGDPDLPQQVPSGHYAPSNVTGAVLLGR